MATKFLGKMVAGAALGGAALLVSAPAVALADDGGHHGNQTEHANFVFTKPKVTTPGEEVKVGEVCADAQEDPHVWSPVFGRVDLEEIHHGKGEHGRGEHGRGEEGRGQHGRGENGKGEEGRQQQGQQGGQQEQGRRGGMGAADSAGAEAEGREHGKRGGEEATGAEGREHGKRGGEEATGAEGREHGKRGGEEATGAEGREHGRHGEHGKKEEKKFVYVGEVTIPEGTLPGRYDIFGTCAQGELVVAPEGSVDGGNGGPATNTGMVATGTGVMTAAALGGLVVLRRRRASGSAA